MSRATRVSGAASPVRPWRIARNWLGGAPIEDPVDRRNAPMLQLVQLFLGVVPPLLWLYRIALSGLPWRPAETISLATSLFLSAVALAGLVLVRKGRFRPAAAALIGTAVVLMLIEYARTGFEAQAYEQPAEVIWIVLAGLVLGRLALWLAYGAHVLAFALGLARDLAAHSGTGFDAWYNQLVSALITALIFLLIAIVIDRAGSALRASLAEATRRGDELARANALLTAEMEQRERLRDQLVHARKVEAVGRLASGVAHDFKHLIGLILGYARIGASSEDIAALRSALAGAAAAAQRADALTGTLLGFVRNEAIRLEVFDAGEVVRDLRPLLVQLFDGKVRLEIKTPERPIPIRFDRGHLSLVALNIASNAMDAMPDGGTFRIVLRNDHERRVELAFSDTGVGMTEEVAGRVFEPFFTTKRAGQGTGLGLAVVADLVGASGGTIEVASAPGRGTLLTIRFPAVDRVDLSSHDVAAMSRAASDTPSEAA